MENPSTTEDMQHKHLFLSPGVVAILKKMAERRSTTTYPIGRCIQLARLLEDCEAAGKTIKVHSPDGKVETLSMLP